MTPQCTSTADGDADRDYDFDWSDERPCPICGMPPFGQWDQDDDSAPTGRKPEEGHRG